MVPSVMACMQRAHVHSACIRMGSNVGFQAGFRQVSGLVWGLLACR